VTQKINLLDARFRQQKRHFSAATLALALGAVLALALAFQQLYAWQNRGLSATLAQTESRTAKLREDILRFAKEFGGQGSSAALGDEIARLEEALRARRSLLSTMQTGAGNAEGFSPYLAALARRTTHGVWLTGIDIGGDLIIKGRALEGGQVPAYIRLLNREEAFAGRAVNQLSLTAAKAGHLDFSLSIPLDKGPM
jgi:hypothetical protein